MPEIDASKCTCGREVFPARRYCPDCQRPMTPARLPGEGIVETWTTIHVPPEGFEPPVHVALVRISAGVKGKPAVRVVARTDGPVETGRPVRLRPEGEVLWAQPA